MSPAAWTPSPGSFLMINLVPGVGEVVAQVVEVGSGPVGSDGLAGGLGVGQRLVSGGDPGRG
jgi:hypothetical protein